MAEQKIKYGRGQNPNSVKNLRPHRKGEPSLNPNGRPPREKSLTEACRRKVMQGKIGKIRTLEVLANDIVHRSRTDPRALKLLWERLEGAVPQPISAELKGDVTWIIGKGYATTPTEGKAKDADTKPGIQADQQDAE